MFASQLLRILETLPGDVKYETCSFDTADLKVRMKENQNGILCHSDGYHKEEESLSFTTKDLRHSNGHGKDADPLALRKIDRIDIWNVPELERSSVVDDCIKDNETEIRVSPTKEDQSGFLYHLSGCKRDEDPLTSDRKDRNKLWNAPEFECAMMNDFSNHNKHETQDSGSPFVTSSELFRADTHIYTDKNVMESELPELTVRYKAINYHVVNDICIDEGMPVEDEGLTGRYTDDRAGLSVSLPSNEYRQNKTSDGRLDFKLFIPDGPKPSREEDIDDADKCGIKEETNIISLVSGTPKCFPESSANKDGRSPEDLTQACETKSNAPNKIENDVSEEESIVTSMLPLQEFGTRSFLRSFMDSLNNDGDEVPQQHNQIPSIVANLESNTAVLEAEESNKNGPANKSLYNSKVENGTITFHFNSPNAADSRGRSADTIEQSLKSDDVLNHNDGNTSNPLAASLVQDAGMDGSTLNTHQESMLNPKNRNSNNPFIVSEVQSTSMDGSTENFHQETLVNHKKGNSNNPFAIGEVQNASMDQSSENIHQAPMLSRKKGNFNPFAFSEVENVNIDTDTENIHRPPMLNPENEKSNNPFAVSEVQYAGMDVSSESIHQQHALNHEIGNTTNPFAVYEVQGSSMDGDTESIHQQPELKRNNGNSSNPFANSEVQSSRMDGITTNIHEEPLKLDNTPDHRNGTGKGLSANHEGISNNISINDQGQCGNGETSFSAAGPPSGLITYSGPITYSGSTSLRSDSSTTSTRSFAFPVLQSEWNSSPVRMGKADARHFRKHRGWKQGILCCKF